MSRGSNDTTIVVIIAAVCCLCLAGMAFAYFMNLGGIKDKISGWFTTDAPSAPENPPASNPAAGTDGSGSTSTTGNTAEASDGSVVVGAGVQSTSEVVTPLSAGTTDKGVPAPVASGCSLWVCPAGFDAADKGPNDQQCFNSSINEYSARVCHDTNAARSGGAQFNKSVASWQCPTGYFWTGKSGAEQCLQPQLMRYHAAICPQGDCGSSKVGNSIGPVKPVAQPQQRVGLPGIAGTAAQQAAYQQSQAKVGYPGIAGTAAQQAAYQQSQAKLGYPGIAGTAAEQAAYQRSQAKLGYPGIAGTAAQQAAYQQSQAGNKQLPRSCMSVSRDKTTQKIVYKPYSCTEDDYQKQQKAMQLPRAPQTPTGALQELADYAASQKNKTGNARRVRSSSRKRRVKKQRSAKAARGRLSRTRRRSRDFI